MESPTPLNTGFTDRRSVATSMCRERERSLNFDYKVRTARLDGKGCEEVEVISVKGLNELDAKVKLKQKVRKAEKRIVVELGYECWRTSIRGEKVVLELKEHVPVGKSRRLKHNPVLAKICEKHSLRMAHQPL